jgi:Cu(I)/Ag(I) efflux system membrane fusion protein
MKLKIFIISVTLLTGIFIGWLFFHSSQKEVKKSIEQTEAVKSTIWTCAMHPQIRMPQPGNCPICGMELIPLVQKSTSSEQRGHSIG